MTWIPNRIVLISHGRVDEAVSNADIYPGMALQLNSAGLVAPHAVIGGQSPKMIATEDALRGLDITQKMLSGNTVPFYRPVPGDEFLMLLQTGSNVAANSPLMSAGDGTMIASTASFSSTLYQIVAASSNITNLNTETTFSNGSYTVPANFLLAGDILHIRALAVVSGQNSTNTHRERLYIGSTDLADGTAISMAAADYYLVDYYLTVRSIGASGKIVGEGLMTTTISATATETPLTLASTTLDTTATAVIKVTSLASAASSGNIVALQQYQIDLQRAGGTNTLVFAAQAVDNSGGTGTSGFNNAAFIRVWIP